MNTKELVDEYRRLLLISEQEADQFAALHQDNAFFVSVVEFGKRLIPAMVRAFSPRVETIQNIGRETDPVIREALNESVKEDIMDELEQTGVFKPNSPSAFDNRLNLPTQLPEASTVKNLDQKEEI